MQRKTNDNLTYDYNIYRIPVNRVDNFCEFLESRMYEEKPLKEELIVNSNEFSFKLMFCDKYNRKGSPWISLISSCCECELSKDFKIYGAALICQSETTCFVISYGNAHFYLSDYCDYSFGIKIAERLINLDSIKAQKNVSHGSKLNKTHIDYLSNSTLSYRGGEIPTYIKGNSINEDIWGKSIHCGTSAQFKWKEKPLELGEKLALLEQIYNSESTLSLPRLIALDNDRDANKINDLFSILAESIANYDESNQNNTLINVPSFYMVGTKLIQNDSIRFKISCDRKSKSYDGELSLDAIKSFLFEKELDIYDSIRKIKLSVEYGNDQWTPYKPLIEYLEFVTDNNFCLRKGKWCVFNNSYIEQVIRDVNKVNFVNYNNSDWCFDKEDLIKYAQTNNIYEDSEKQPYETYYNHKLATMLNGNIIHPTTVPVDEQANRRYRYEVCDFTVESKMYFVKIGTPADFSYAVDQAMFTLSKVQNGYGKVKLPNGEFFEPTEFHLVLINDKRKKIINKWEDVYSINFLIHMSDLKQSLNSMNISLFVDFVYNF